jgi:glutathione peroxidase-family protein
MESHISCSGLTNSNYKELNVLYEKYREKGQSIFFLSESAYSDITPEKIKIFNTCNQA